MSTWRHFELGARVRKTAGGGEERLGLDRRSGRPVTLVVYPRPRGQAALPEPVGGAVQHLAQPLALVSEGGEAIVVRELAFGPSIEDLLLLGPQSTMVVATLLRQLLDGLARWHAAGRVHLRLSPSAVRFDLLSGQLKVTDLEEASVDSSSPDSLIPRYLEPAVRTGQGRTEHDVYSVGRIGEALLRGGAPLGPWGNGAAPAPGALWDFIQGCQAPEPSDRPHDAVEALSQLERLGLPPAAALALPLGGFVRRHVGALRELRRWRAQPLPPPAGEVTDRGYRELVSSGQAAKLWAAIGVAALFFVGATFALAESPGRRPGQSSLPSETCLAEARPQPLDARAAGPAGSVAIRLAVPPGQAMAVDGCPVMSEPGRETRLAVSRGVHEFRAADGSRSLARSIEVRDGDSVALDLDKAPSEGLPDAVGVLARRLQQGPSPSEEAEPFDPVEAGMLASESRQLLRADRAVFGGRPGASSDLPLSLGLAIDALRAARRRFDSAAAPCAASLANAALQELGSGTGESEQALQLAAELLTVTRIRGAQLREPLRTERESLERLQVSPSRRLLTAVEHLSSRPELGHCLADLGGQAGEINDLAALALAEIPGVRLSDEPPADDSTE